MELGIYTFVENTPDPGTGQMIPPHTRIRNLMEEIQLAEQVGLDVFAIGEHHRPEYLASSPAVLLAAAAVKTKRDLTFPPNGSSWIPQSYCESTWTATSATEGAFMMI